MEERACLIWDMITRQLRADICKDATLNDWDFVVLVGDEIKVMEVYKAIRENGLTKPKEIQEFIYQAGVYCLSRIPEYDRQPLLKSLIRR
ncbi:MAG: hypothetical protein ACOVOV_18765 [Dolichospermum sp.]